MLARRRVEGAGGGGGGGGGGEGAGGRWRHALARRRVEGTWWRGRHALEGGRHWGKVEACPS